MCILIAIDLQAMVFTLHDQCCETPPALAPSLEVQVLRKRLSSMLIDAIFELVHQD